MMGLQLAQKKHEAIARLLCPVQDNQVKLNG